MQRKHQLITIASVIAFVCILSFGLLAITPSTTLAIGEVTPTPTSAPNLSFDEYVVQGIEEIQSGNYTAAVDSFTNALAIQEDPDVYYARAFAYGQLGNFQAAVDDYTAVLDLRVYDWDALSSRGFIYAQMGNTDAAMADYNEALYRNPRFDLVFLNLSDLYNNQGNGDEAAIMISVARALDARNLGDSAGALENFEVAISEMNAIEGGVLSDEQQAAIYYNRALSYHDQEDWDNAIADYTTAIEIMPNMQDSFLARGIVYRETDDLVSAGSDFVTRMELIELERFDEGVLEFGDFAEVDMQYGYIYVYTFEGTEGQIVDISADDADGSGVDALIALLDDSGNPIAGDDDYGGAFDSGLADYALPYTGTYTLYVSHANGAFDGLIRVTLEEYIPAGSF